MKHGNVTARKYLKALIITNKQKRSVVKITTFGCVKCNDESQKIVDIDEKKTYMYIANDRHRVPSNDIIFLEVKENLVALFQQLINWHNLQAKFLFPVS